MSHYLGVVIFTKKEANHNKTCNSKEQKNKTTQVSDANFTIKLFKM